MWPSIVLHISEWPAKYHTAELCDLSFFNVIYLFKALWHLAAGFRENDLEHILFLTFDQSLLPLLQFSSSCSLATGCYFLRQEVGGDMSGHNCVFQQLQLTSKRPDADGRCSCTPTHASTWLICAELACFKYGSESVWYQVFLSHQNPEFGQVI